MIKTKNNYGTSLHQYAVQYSSTPEHSEIGHDQIVILILNYDRAHHHIIFNDSVVNQFDHQTIYQVTSDDLQSDKVFINGKLALFPRNTNNSPDVLQYGRTSRVGTNDNKDLPINTLIY